MWLFWTTACLTAADKPEHLWDEDGDGFLAFEDCDDHNASVYPGAPEYCGDGIDSACDGDPTDAGIATFLGEEGLRDVSEELSSVGVLEIEESGSLYICEGSWIGQVKSRAEELVIYGGPGVVLDGNRGHAALVVESGITWAYDLEIRNGGGCVGSSVRVAQLDACTETYAALAPVDATLYLQDSLVLGGEDERGDASVLVVGGRLELSGTLVRSSQDHGVELIDGNLQCHGHSARAGVVDSKGWGAWMQGESLLRSNGCDWGQAGHENLGGDVWFEDHRYEAQDNAWFVCSVESGCLAQ